MMHVFENSLYINTQCDLARVKKIVLIFRTSLYKRKKEKGDIDCCTTHCSTNRLPSVLSLTQLCRDNFIR